MAAKIANITCGKRKQSTVALDPGDLSIEGRQYVVGKHCRRHLEAHAVWPASGYEMTRSNTAAAPCASQSSSPPIIHQSPTFRMDIVVARPGRHSCPR